MRHLCKLTYRAKATGKIPKIKIRRVAGAIKR
jgi:hypothetical protein